VGLLFNQLFKFPGPSQAKQKQTHIAILAKEFVCFILQDRKKKKNVCLMFSLFFLFSLSRSLCSPLMMKAE
jgi:hypothetical protein